MNKEEGVLEASEAQSSASKENLAAPDPVLPSAEPDDAMATLEWKGYPPADVPTARTLTVTPIYFDYSAYLHAAEVKSGGSTGMNITHEAVLLCNQGFMFVARNRAHIP